MPIIMNHALSQLVMFSAAWSQLKLRFKKCNRVIYFVVFLVMPGVAQSENQPNGITHDNHIAIAGISGDVQVYRDLVHDLILEAALIADLSVPTQVPPIVFADKETVSHYACAGTCRALGAYHPKYGIALDQSLDPVKDDLARSILLHELVHYLQHEDGRYADAGDCDRWVKRERDAYAAQNKFLRKIQSTSRVSHSLRNSCLVKSG